MTRERKIPVGSLPRLFEAAVSIVALCLCSACGGNGGIRHERDVLLQTDGCNIFADSMVFDNGMTIRAVGDTLLQVRLDGVTLKQMIIPQPMSDLLTLKSGFPLLDALVRLEGATESPNSVSDAMLWNAALNPIQTVANGRLISSRLANGYPVPQEVGALTWPVVNANPAWLLAAAEWVKSTGNQRDLSIVATAVESTLKEDLRVCRNEAIGLFYGVPHYLADVKNFFPEWMQTCDMFECQTFGVNMGYVLALRSINDINRVMLRRKYPVAISIEPLDADTLMHTIVREMWMPRQCRFSAMSYGFALWPIAIDVPDNFMQAMAVAMGALSESMADAVAASLPVDAELSILGVREQSIGSVGAMVRRLMVVGGCIAQAKTARWQHFDSFMALLVKSVGLDVLTGRRDWLALRPLSTVMLRGVLGTHFGWDALRFSPFLPIWFGENAVVDFHWRKANVRVELSGHGNNPIACSMNNSPVEPLIDHSLSGDLLLKIAMWKDSDTDICLDDVVPPHSKIERQPFSFLPLPPYVVWNTPLVATVVADPDGGNDMPSVRVWENGVIIDETDRRTIEFDEAAQLRCIQIASVSSKENVSGFSAPPHLILPNGVESIVRLSDVASAGTKTIEDKAIAAQFVESSRNANRNIKFSVCVGSSGRYMIDVHYLSGLGIVNQKRGTALRMCVINGERAGVFVFPQLPPSRWDRTLGDGWQTLNTFSNPLIADLNEGENQIELRYFQTSPVYLDPTANSFVADYVRLIPIQ